MSYIQYFRNRFNINLVNKFKNVNILEIKHNELYKCNCGVSPAIKVFFYYAYDNKINEYILINCESCLNLYGDGILDN